MPAFTETVKLVTRPAATLLRAPTTKNAAERPLRFAIRNSTLPAGIARGDTAHEARLMVTVTVACVPQPSAVAAMARNADRTANAANVPTDPRLLPAIT